MQSRERNIHPVVIISTFNKTMKESLAIIDRISVPIDVNDDDKMFALKISEPSLSYTGPSLCASWLFKLCVRLREMTPALQLSTSSRMRVLRRYRARAERSNSREF